MTAACAFVLWACPAAARPSPPAAPGGASRPSRPPKAPPAAVTPQSPPAPDSPPDPAAEQARQLIRQAGTLLNQGDHASAVAILQQAQRLHKDATISYNLGVAYAEGGRHPEAAAAFSDFLVQIDRDPALRRGVLPERVADVRQRLATYRTTLSRLRLTLSGPPGLALQRAVASADGRPLPQPSAGSDDPCWLRPGPHELRVQAEGASEYIARVDLAPGEERIMAVTLSAAPLAGALALVPTAAPEPPPPLYKRWWFWAAVGSGVVLTSALIGAGAAGRMDRLAPGTDLPPLEVAR